MRLRTKMEILMSSEYVFSPVIVQKMSLLVSVGVRTVVPKMGRWAREGSLFVLQILSKGLAHFIFHNLQCSLNFINAGG